MSTWTYPNDFFDRECEHKRYHLLFIPQIYSDVAVNIGGFFLRERVQDLNLMADDVRRGIPRITSLTFLIQ